MGIGREDHRDNREAITRQEEAYVGWKLRKDST